MYDYTDKVVRSLLRYFLQVFGNVKGALASFDKLNVIVYAKDLYRQLEQYTDRRFLLIGKNAYKNASIVCENAGFPKKKKRTHVDEAWLDVILSIYDPVTLYVYRHEVERKKSRFAEAVVASPDKNREVNKALRLWSRMIKQYAITVTDTATLGAYRDHGVERVRWLTEPDDRRCEVCLSRDHEIFLIDEIPPKHHINCRCWLVPYKEGKDD